jgi:hypothetical protein
MIGGEARGCKGGSEHLEAVPSSWPALSLPSYSPLMRARSTLFLLVGGLMAAFWLLRATGSDAQPSSSQAWVTPQEVLVLFNTRWPGVPGFRGQ